MQLEKCPLNHIMSYFYFNLLICFSVALLHLIRHCMTFILLRPSDRPRHQTEIVSGAHPGAKARIAYTRAMSEHRCQKETKYSYNAFQARDKRDKSKCDSASMEHRVAIWSFSFFKYQKCPKIPQFLCGNPDGT